MTRTRKRRKTTNRFILVEMLAFILIVIGVFKLIDTPTKVIAQREIAWEYVNLREKPTTAVKEYDILTEIPQGATVEVVREEVSHGYHTWDEVIFTDETGTIWRGYVAVTSYAS